MTRTRTFRIAVRKYPPFEETIRQQWRNFESEARTGLTLDLVPLDLHPLEEALFASKGMASGEWDVAFIATDWIASMHQQQCAVDLAPLLQSNPPDDYPQGWTESLLRLQRIGPAVLGVPFHDGPECLIYRKDIFDDADTQARYNEQFGEPLAPPKTWAEFHRIARFLHAPEKDLYGTVFAAYPDGHNTVYDFLLQLWTRGGELVDAGGAVCFSTPEAEAALAFYREIISDADATHPACRNLDSVQAGLAFSAGNVAMMVNWFGFATMAHTWADSVVRGLVDIAPVPLAEEGSTVSLNVYWILSIAAGSPHREVAWRFLRHGLTPAMDKLPTTLGAIGCRKSTWRDPEVNRAIPFYHRIEQLHASAREIPQRADWPRIAATIDRLVTQTLTTVEPISALLAAADHAVQ